jgi:hypothetical protein
MSPDQLPAAFPGRSVGAGSSGQAHAGEVPAISDYPELQPVVSLALDAVISSFYPQKIGQDLRNYLERVTSTATVATYAPIAAIALRTRRGAEDTRVARTTAVARAAQEMADRVAEVAAHLQTREQASADTVAREASKAAEKVALSTGPEHPAQMAVTAASVAAAVHDAAAEALLETAHAAAVVANAATTAAAEVATAADAAALIIELHVLRSASALQAIALETCYQFAINTAASAAEAVLADGMP